LTVQRDFSLDALAARIEALLRKVR
jgi:hypothetical protein